MINYKLFLGCGYGVVLLGGIFFHVSPAEARSFPESTQTASLNQWLIAETCDKDEGCYRDPPKSADVPHIIAPTFRTSVYSSQPTLLWRPVLGVSYYTLYIEGISSDFQWEEVVGGQDYWKAYDGAPLQPGNRYRFYIEASNGKSSRKIQFFVLSEEQRQQIETDIEQVKQNVSGEVEQTIAIAQMLVDKYKLSFEAINRLESLVSSGTNKPQAYNLLANLYQEMGLTNMASSIRERANQRGISLD